MTTRYQTCADRRYAGEAKRGSYFSGAGRELCREQPLELVNPAKPGRNAKPLFDEAGHSVVAQRSRPSLSQRLAITYKCNFTLGAFLAGCRKNQFLHKQLSAPCDKTGFLPF